MIFYKLRFGKSISFQGVPNLAHGTQIKIITGEILIGKGLRVQPRAYFAAVNGGHIVFGNNVSINRNTIVISHESITIGDGCAIGPNVLMYDHDHSFGTEGLMRGYKTSPINIEKNCWIGAGVIILRGSHIGEGCVIGAGTVVKGDIPPHSIVTSEVSKQLCIRPVVDR
jgi:acetyltransferase-like isoleucine patch superfamily enzyme